MLPLESNFFPKRKLKSWKEAVIVILCSHKIVIHHFCRVETNLIWTSGLLFNKDFNIFRYECLHLCSTLSGCGSNHRCLMTLWIRQTFVPQTCCVSLLAAPPVPSEPAILFLPSPPLDSEEKNIKVSHYVIIIIIDRCWSFLRICVGQVLFLSVRAESSCKKAKLIPPGINPVLWILIHFLCFISTS